MGKEGLDFAFTLIEFGSGLHIEVFNIAFNPVAVCFFGTDGIVTPAHHIPCLFKYSACHNKTSWIIYLIKKAEEILNIEDKQYYLKTRSISEYQPKLPVNNMLD